MRPAGKRAFQATVPISAIVLLSAIASAQVTFEQAVRDIGSPDADVRLKAVRMLKDANYPEAAVPLAAAVTDARDEVQLEAIAAELNIFLAERIVPRKRLGFVVEVRKSIAAEPTFASGPLSLGSRAVPPEVMTALRSAAGDDNPRVGLEALYAFGTLAVVPAGAERRELLQASGPQLAALVGSRDRGLRFAALRVLGRVFERRPGDGAVDEAVGDAVVAAVNDPERAVRTAAMDTLGGIRYERGVQAATEQFQYFGKGEMAAGALDALARIASAASEPIFTAQIASKESAVRAIAIEGLARLGDSARLATIKEATRRENSGPVQLAIDFAACRLSETPLDPIVEALAKPRLRDQALRYLSEIAVGRSPAFARYLQDPDPRMRTDIVDVLALARDPAALPLVEPLTRDADPLVARAAERATAWLRAEQ